MDPINYAAYLPQADFTRSIMGGLQAGGDIRQTINAAQDRERQLGQLRAYQSDISQYMQAPTAQGAAALSLKYQGQREAIAAAFKDVSADRQQAELKAGNMIYGALNTGRPDVAASVLQNRITALSNAGQDASQEQQWLQVLQSDPVNGPRQVQGMLGYGLAALDPKFTENHAKFGTEQRAAELQPAAVAKAGADAQTAIVGAKFAESKAVADLNLNAAQIKKMEADAQIARENSRIAAINAAISRESNDLKRQELSLKINDAIRDRDDKLRAKHADVESSRSTIDNFLNTADRILKTDPGVIQRATGTVDSRMPTSREDTANLESLVETLSSQAFLSQIPSMKGTGALTEREGDKLQASLANLSLRQSRPQLVSNIQEAQRLMLKARQNLASRYGLPDNVPDRPALGGQPVSGMPAGFKVLGKE